MFSWEKHTAAHRPIRYPFPQTVEAALALRLSDLPDAFLSATCCYTKEAGAAWFLSQCGEQRLGDFVGRLTCKRCGGRPRAVSLQDAPYYRPGVAGEHRLYLIGDESVRIEAEHRAGPGPAARLASPAS